MKKLTEINPKNVFEFFELLCSVPHGSFNVERISELCCDFARARGLEYFRDGAGNVIIKKPASKGFEGRPAVILQGHMDMVAVKNPDCDIDLEKDGLRLASDGEYVWAEGTSLGADDCVALAMIMAILDSEDIEHPPIEALFTVNEEVGMLGASALDASLLSGKTMINIDSEEENVITVGCAGGILLTASFPMKRTKDYVHAAMIAIYGLTGGHSGGEIHKNRANSNVLMAQLLTKLGDVRLISANGGDKPNAIANKTVCRIALSDFAAAKKAVETFEQEVKEKYAETDPGLTVRIVDEGFKNSGAADLISSRRIIKALNELPDGVQTMSDAIEGLVQTSLNFGVLNISDFRTELTYCLRSSVSAEKLALREKLEGIIKANRGRAEFSGDYPAWEYREESSLRSVAVMSYEKLYGRKPGLSVIHAGLECGILSGKIPGLDCISIGPDILNIHTTSERLSVASTERTFELVLDIRKNL